VITFLEAKAASLSTLSCPTIAMIAFTKVIKTNNVGNIPVTNPIKFSPPRLNNLINASAKFAICCIRFPPFIF